MLRYQVDQVYGKFEVPKNYCQKIEVKTLRIDGQDKLSFTVLIWNFKENKWMPYGKKSFTINLMIAKECLMPQLEEMLKHFSRPALTRKMSTEETARMNGNNKDNKVSDGESA